MALQSSPSNGFSLLVLQARLEVSVASVGVMRPFARVGYSGVNMDTRVVDYNGGSPHWNEIFNVEYLDNHLEVMVFHKPFLLREVEIGKCSVKVADVSGWFEIYKGGLRTGAVRLCLKEENDSGGGSPRDSRDIKNEYSKKVNELELEKEEAIFYKKKYKAQLEKLRQLKRKLWSPPLGKTPEHTGTVEILQEHYKHNMKRREQLLSEQEIELEEKRTREMKETLMSEKRALEETKTTLNSQKEKLEKELLKIKEFKQQRALERSHSPRDQRVRSAVALDIYELPYSQPRRAISSEEEYYNRHWLTTQQTRPPLHPISLNRSSRLISFR